MAKNYLKIPQADLKKIAELKNQSDSEIDESQMFIAEFGKHYGWAGVEAIVNNKIDMDTALWLMEGARKLDARNTHEAARAVLIGYSSSKAKNPANAFKRMTASLIKQMRVAI